MPASPRRTGSLRRVDGRREDSVDWGLVKALRQKASVALSEKIKDRPGISDRDQWELAQPIVEGLLREHLIGTYADLGTAEHAALIEAVLDALFGLGRLQSLVDDDRIENIEVYGFDNVTLEYEDGTLKPSPAIADSDEDLIADLQFLASRRAAGSERRFSRAHPALDLTLRGGHRLSAVAFVSSRPSVTIRRHRLIDIDLNDLANEYEAMPVLVADFLAAAVRAKKSIVVSGEQAAGKTTLLRALVNAMDPDERLMTVETEFELRLDQFPNRHRRIVAIEARPGAGEPATDGHAAGEFSINDALYYGFRQNISRTIVGEVRGSEIRGMFQAMSTGSGSLSTTHAPSARKAIGRLVLAATEDGAMSEAHALSQVAWNIDLIVQLQRRGDYRFVSEIIEVDRGMEGSRPQITDVCTLDASNELRFRTLPSWVDDLGDFGFDVSRVRAAATGVGE